MESAPHRSFVYGGTVLLGLFLVFGLFLTASAQEDVVTPEAVLFQMESEGVIEESDEVATDLTPELLDFSMTHTEEEEASSGSYIPSPDFYSVEGVHNISVQMAVFGFLFLLLLTMFAFLVRSSYGKKFIFTSMVLVIVLPTLFFIASTIYTNVISETRGPVHWHTDFKIYACGEELAPPDPKGVLSNKTGTPVLHQHVDERVHVEGVLIDTLDASFQNFVRVQGGQLTDSSFTVPSGDGFRTYTNGDLCDGKPSEWNAFIYRTDVENNTVSKERLTDVVNYVPAPHIEVPPGDCIILEFGPRQNDTDKICRFYQIEINKGNLIPTWNQ